MEEFKQSLIKLFNETPLPSEAKVYVIRDFYRNVEDAYKMSLAQAQTKQEVTPDE